MPASARARSSSPPEGPTKGWPSTSSRSPGCSPTSMIGACSAPSPKTVCVAPCHNRHLRQPAASRRSFAKTSSLPSERAIARSSTRARGRQAAWRARRSRAPPLSPARSAPVAGDAADLAIVLEDRPPQFADRGELAVAELLLDVLDRNPLAAKVLLDRAPVLDEHDRLTLGNEAH